MSFHLNVKDSAKLSKPVHFDKVMAESLPEPRDTTRGGNAWASILMASLAMAIIYGCLLVMLSH